MSALLCAAALGALSPSAHSQTPEEWIRLGSYVHGGFGALIPVGIRIGLDALERLGANRRDLDVLFFSGLKAPCACIADGIMLATGSSPGQGTLRIAADPAEAGLLATVVIRNRKTGASARYSISGDWLPALLQLNATRDPLGRFEAVMAADGLFLVE
ncbi:MAG: formylmethanofuran dehydrogenase subunit E family protein [Betaproteobacteria bacterium]